MSTSIYFEVVDQAAQERVPTHPLDRQEIILAGSGRQKGISGEREASTLSANDATVGLDLRLQAIQTLGALYLAHETTSKVRGYA